MKKVLITRRLIRESEDKASKLFDAKFNTNDELYSQKKIIEMSEGCDGILSSLTEKLDAETINQLPNSVKIISNFAVGFGNIDLEAAKNRGIAVTNTPEVHGAAAPPAGVYGPGGHRCPGDGGDQRRLRASGGGGTGLPGRG